ncbi:MAG: hypothetical protein AAFS10_09000 [Myxococcota bacterium]
MHTTPMTIHTLIREDPDSDEDGGVASCGSGALDLEGSGAEGGGFELGGVGPGVDTAPTETFHGSSSAIGTGERFGGSEGWGVCWATIWLSSPVRSASTTVAAR